MMMWEWIILMWIIMVIILYWVIVIKVLLHRR